MGLFGQVVALAQKERFPLEDIHTEIVAQVLRDSPTLTLAWLRAIGATMLGSAKLASVTPQKTFPALAHHPVDSRPDLTISLAGAEGRELIFVESKVGAAEGEGQLQRYAEYLAAADAGVRRTALVYVTRDWEEKSAPTVDPSRFTFVQTRWHEFYPLLVTHAGNDGLARQLQHFMQEHGMTQRDQFTAIDSLALGNFRAAFKLMDATMWGEVAQEFTRAVGFPVSRTAAHGVLRVEGDYLMYNWLDPEHYLQVLLGYWLPDEGPTASAWLGVTIYSSPTASLRKETIAAMGRFL